jgi:hypothetical protein
MEIIGENDAAGKEITLDNPNRRRLMFGWSYRLNIAVNEKLDIAFRLSDPNVEAGATIAGSGSNLGNLLGVVLPNAYFTWKPVSAFNFSGGLLDFAGNSLLDLETSWEKKNPTNAYGNTYWNSLAGVNFSFPVTPAAKIFLTAGIVDNTLYGTAQFLTKADGTKDTIAPYSNARIVFGADLSLAEKKVSLKPVISIKTRGDISKSDTSITHKAGEDGAVVSSSKITTTKSIDRSPVIGEGIDASIKIAKPFSLNVGVSAVEDFAGDNKNDYLIVGAGIEPIVTFGGENGKLITIRAKYAFDIANNIADSAASKDNDKSSLTNHIDARFSLAVNDKMSIAPRLRYWSQNSGGNGKGGGDWYGRATSAYSDNDKRSRSFARWEVAFTTTF